MDDNAFRFTIVCHTLHQELCRNDINNSLGGNASHNKLCRNIGLWWTHLGFNTGTKLSHSFKSKFNTSRFEIKFARNASILSNDSQWRYI